ncbi:MAG TPA: very short patch repair endonuclease [Noviherbaspirillum sp.]|jgi:DNA mismatch endonuclease (patch repair protein)|uniref:very short patch repair endonuclease n=1 Tax=Noviherbaspirillum sp. TaxID=1926288 RepID=UPI002DDCFF90|nr:very short patch repair endonuclease [Noviherbaspirillum sp.]HEV2610621.1 very short patch repair endonuclease [Noviherbaspirillum sp.]
MADRITQEQRSAVMAKIRSKDTKPELALRSALHRLGFRFLVHRKDLPGRPDIVLPKHKTVIFVHGCFWHQHSNCKDGHKPLSREHYWYPKLEKNVIRDEENRRLLESLGWKVFTVWECEIQADLQRKAKQLSERLRGVNDCEQS